MISLRSYLDLTKFGITIFSVLAGLAGYALSYPIERSFDITHLFLFLLGLYALSAGSLALNQCQEWELDQLMPRTAKRPIPSGKVSVKAALVLAFVHLLIGVIALYMVSLPACVVGLITVFLYNGPYTYIWKRKWAFGAVPGAVPGAMPVVIGYAAHTADLFTTEVLYVFLIMFLWQMPHFWLIAIRFKDHYAKAGFPVLPTVLGVERTLYHIGLYTFVYVGVALMSPWLVEASWVYLVIVVPCAVMVLIEFFRYFRSNGTSRWLHFFMWTNFSMLIFITVPIVDKWLFLLTY